MAHFAELDTDNKVLRVIVISDDETHDTDGLEQEALGIAFCQSLFGANTNWVQTSYNASIKGKYAAVGDFFDSATDTFIAPEVILVNPLIIDETPTPVLEEPTNDTI